MKSVTSENGARTRGSKSNGPLKSVVSKTGVKANGKHLNGHGGKSAADNMIDAKPGIFAKAEGEQGRETSASA